jgi:K+-transporting ATPase ATPase C chain
VNNTSNEPERTSTQVLDEPSTEEEEEPPSRKPWTTIRDQAGRFLRLGWDALKVVIILTLICGVLFPALVLALGQLAFNHQANGSLIRNDQGVIIGSELIGQQFTRPEYFHGRPSVVGYNAASSGGSNLGPTNPQRIDGNGSTYAGMKSYADQFRAENSIPAATELPSDIVSASGSGLDPHISVDAARLQVNRVVAARRTITAGGRPLPSITPERVNDLITRRVEGRELGVLGEPRVNVLELNMDLDATFGAPVEAGGAGR